MDWNRFQLVSLAVAAGILLIRALFLWRVTRINVVKVRHPSEAGFVVGEAVFVFLILRHTHIVDVPLPAWVDRVIIASGVSQLAGAAFILAGIFIFAFALLSFGNSWRIGIDRRTPGALVTTGMFRLSRNPIFVFMDLHLAGTFLINGTVIFFLAALLGAAFLHIQILREERFLSEQYGEAYRKYCANTSRYL